jgi:hypothetical protein
MVANASSVTPLSLRVKKSLLLGIPSISVNYFEYVSAFPCRSTNMFGIRRNRKDIGLQYPVIRGAEAARFVLRVFLDFFFA